MSLSTKEVKVLKGNSDKGEDTVSTLYLKESARWAKP